MVLWKRAVFEIEHAEQMLWVGIAGENSVSIDRNVGPVGFWEHEQLVHRLFEAIKYDFGFEL